MIGPHSAKHPQVTPLSTSGQFPKSAQDSSNKEVVVTVVEVVGGMGLALTLVEGVGVVPAECRCTVSHTPMLFSSRKLHIQFPKHFATRFRSSGSQDNVPRNCAVVAPRFVTIWRQVRCRWSRTCCFTLQPPRTGGLLLIGMRAPSCKVHLAKSSIQPPGPSEAASFRSRPGDKSIVQEELQLLTSSDPPWATDRKDCKSLLPLEPWHKVNLRAKSSGCIWVLAINVVGVLESIPGQHSTRPRHDFTSDKNRQ